MQPVDERPCSKVGESVLALWNVVAIGQLLDSGEMPCATTGGVILPDSAAGCPNASGKEDKNVQSKRKAPRLEQAGSTRWEGAARQSGTSGQSGESPAANPETPDIESRTAAEARTIAELHEAYPGASGRRVAGSYWLHVPIKLLPGPEPRAFLICELENQSTKMPRAWAFWPDGSWVGPRHTNSPDGSICAFHIEDQSWEPGDSLVTLFDMYSLWVVRQLHLKLVGWWPGEQVALHRAERVAELEPNEWCGCTRPSGRYADCCQSGDLAELSLAEAIEFNLHLRVVPDKVHRIREEFHSP